MIKRIGLVYEIFEDVKRLGLKPENARHWREAGELDAIEASIRNAGHEVIRIGSPYDLLNRLDDYKRRINLIFNLSVGFTDRFRLAQGPALYHLAGIPYTGADPYSKMLSQNKHLMKAFFDKTGIPTPAWVYIHSKEDLEKAELPPFPLIVKPAHEGSSVGLSEDSVVRDREIFMKVASGLFDSLGMPLIAERFITGREFKVAIIGNEEIRFMGISEDVIGNEPVGDKFLHYRAKKDGMFGKRSIDIEAEQWKTLVMDCLKAYKLFLPLDFATLDIRIDNKGQHYILELNADASLHPEQSFARTCELNGLSYQEAISVILDEAIQRQS